MKKSIEAFKKMNRKNKIILVSILSGIILIFGATTFAFFSSSINGEKQPLSVTTGTLRLDFNDVEGSGIIEGEMGIGKTVSKRMMISNTGTQDVTATIMWNELENTYLAQSLMYTIKQTQEYDLNEEVDINTLEYNQEVPQAGIYVPKSEEPKKTALTRGILIPAGKKIYYEVTITYNHLNDVNQNTDLEAKQYTSFTIEEGEQLEPFTITSSNRSKIGWTAETTDLVIPATFQDENGVWYRVVATKEKKMASRQFGAFENCTNLKSVTILDGVTSIGNRTFCGCYNLKSVTISDSITSISSSAFSGCTKLMSINVDENNRIYKSIDGVLFTKDEKTIAKYPSGRTDTSYTISDSITNIGNSAFSGCRSLTSIAIPDSVTSIGSHAFWNCSSLTSVTIGNSVISIGYNAFWNCRSLTSITIPNSVTSIGSSTFSGCSSLTSINIPDSVTSIGNYAFSGCTGLTSITIPNSVTSIGNYTFNNCTGLTSITIPDSVTSIGNSAFWNCRKLTSITYKGTDYTNKSAFTTTFTATSGNTIGTNVLYGTGLSA